ncbi:hypothetical protein GQR58_006378 [Nymphon striatum]|nr:hypothetical protein GQR58_006378 [Nymphon striatum]
MLFIMVDISASTSVPESLIGKVQGFQDNFKSIVTTVFVKVFNYMSNTTFCQNNCSGHGDCINGACMCEVQYSGGRCTEPNFPYFIAFATIFYTICAVSMIQLLLCVKSEFNRMKQPSLWKACRITTQKMLYFLIFLASAIRGYYFSSPLAEDWFWTKDIDNLSLNWASSLLSAYYPLLLTGASLIVCFWAEVFHIKDLRLDKPRFLSKSFLGFLAFNVITYSLLLSEFVLVQFYDHSNHDHSHSKKDYFTSIFNGCYAVLLLIVVIFFLIYGVEMYFKVCLTIDFSKFEAVFVIAYLTGCAVQRIAAKPACHPVPVHGGFAGERKKSSVNSSQLHQSRFGLVFQAVLLLITVCFLMSDVLGNFWKDKVAVIARNCHDVMFRVVELAVALWFPCVLWNCISPDQLWILNPKKILAKLDITSSAVKEEGDSLVGVSKDCSKPVIVKGLEFKTEQQPECWICYDTERLDVGPLIQPCKCKGDVSVVHHDCLKKWLVESACKPENMNCKVCNDKYVLESGKLWIGNGLNKMKWLQIVGLIGTMTSSAVGAYVTCQFYNDAGIRVLAIGGAFILCYVGFRLLGFNVLSAYQRAKISAVKILGKTINSLKDSEKDKVVTISGSTPEMANMLSSKTGNLHPDIVNDCKMYVPEYKDKNDFPSIDVTINATK